jgi:hypothetical protein
MHGQPHPASAALDPAHWQESDAYLYGVDLFNRGFYWEAHEAWESLWHAAGRQGVIASWLKALIKLAAAAVKLREGNAVGALRHARRSIELLREVRRQLPADCETFAGVRLSELEQVTGKISWLSREHLTPEPELLLDAWIQLGANR